MSILDSRKDNRMSSTLVSPPLVERHESPAAAPLNFEQHSPSAPCRAETAECTCPEFCERDHDND